MSCHLIDYDLFATVEVLFLKIFIAFLCLYIISRYLFSDFQSNGTNCSLTISDLQNYDKLNMERGEPAQEKRIMIMK